ncbi:MAG TPA: hypothetical protein PK185_02615 [Cyclobacteriaceae bacterium]|nr:hypothetical protein [Cyclobacteriaceae bacterium]
MAREYLDETQAYVNEHERLKVAWELLSYANMLYSRVYVFKNYGAFAQSFDANPPSSEYWEGLSYEKLIDDIKICTAFENYNKSVLLSKGVVIHLIDTRKNRVLAKRQKSTPVLISDFLKSNKFIQKDRFSGLYLEGFQNFNTISFSRTLTDSYQEFIDLDSRFLGYLKNLNEKRNRLHYLKNYHGAYRVQTLLDNIAFAKSYGTELLQSEIVKVERLLRKFD